MIGLSDKGLEELLKESRALPARERQHYRDLGWRIIEPGSAIGTYYNFSKAAWMPDSFLAKSPDGEVQISLIRARYSGKGAFSRLLRRLDRLGLRVRVVSPLPHMQAILERKGWTATLEGTTFEDRRDLWERTKQKEIG